MDQFPGLLAKDFGFEPQSKPVPMASNLPKSNSLFHDSDAFLGYSDHRKGRDFSSSSGVFHDVFGGPPKYTNSSSDGRTTTTPLTSSFNIGSMFQDLRSSKTPMSSTTSPVYNDENIFEGLPGLKTTSSSVNSTNAFPSAPKESSSFDDFLGNLGRMESNKLSNSGSRKKWGEVDHSGSAFEELIPGFGGSSPPKNRETLRSGVPQQSGVPSTISTSSVREDPLVVLQSAPVPAYASQRLFSEPLEQDKPNQSSGEVGVSSDQGKIFDDVDPIDSTAKLKSFPLSGGSNIEKDGSRSGSSSNRLHNSVGKEPTGEPPEILNNSLQKNMPSNNTRESHQSLFDAPTFSNSHHTSTQNGSHPYASSTETSSHRVMSPQSEASAVADDVWLTVSEITLITLPTSAPPPSRPPPRPQQILKEIKGSVKLKGSNFSSFYRLGQSYLSPQTVLDAAKSPDISSINGLEGFALDGTRSNADEHVHVISNEDNADNSVAAASAAAMKDAVDRAEVKFKHAKQVRERENAAKVNGAQRERDGKVKQDMQEQDLGEKKEGLDCEQDERGRSEKDREQRRIEKEREQALEIEREREKGRQAVDRAMKEVRERAAAGARQKAERIAVDKVNAGARERAERAAVQRAQAEARERAAIEARERAERAASEAIERKNAEEKEKAAAVARAEAEARIRSDRAAVNRANAEARERAAAAAATRGQQHKDGNDLDSFFNASARPDNISKPRTSSPDSMSDAHLKNRPGPEQTQNSSAGTSSGMRKASSTTNIVDDLDSIFGATSRSADSQEIVGETDGRRRSRLERDQRTQERVKKAVDEKNERDRHTQWEQAEKQRMAESLDFEIKRWSAGKEGNLRTLLSTLHYVLWPECGWQPVSLTDLITSASVKKVYRKATLCIHPDKVQQKGANLQQKLIAEKVFDLLKEAWNKFSSEELF